jgi:hypothetical protein
LYSSGAEGVGVFGDSFETNLLRLASLFHLQELSYYSRPKTLKNQVAAAAVAKTPLKSSDKMQHSESAVVEPFEPLLLLLCGRLLAKPLHILPSCRVDSRVPEDCS